MKRVKGFYIGLPDRRLWLTAREVRHARAYSTMRRAGGDPYGGKCEHGVKLMYHECESCIKAYTFEKDAA